MNRYFMKVRPATHAGTWYQKDKEQVRQSINNFLVTSQRDVKAIIVPHAGLHYSGKTAGVGYGMIKPKNTVFLLGPSHHIYLKGCALSSFDIYESLVDFKLDNEIINDLRETGLFSEIPLDADMSEHSLEMHLPFLSVCCPNASLVPILVGDCVDFTKYAKELEKYFTDDALFVISSDFCHWGSRFRYQPTGGNGVQISDFIRELDHKGMKLIEEKRGFKEYLESTQNTICGRNPILLLLELVDKEKIEFVAYDQSSAVKNMNESSVSYAAAICYK